MPVPGAVELTWGGMNTELDFDHYDIIRDGQVMAVATTDTFYTDADPALADDLHTYSIRAVDTLGNYSDTSEGMTVTARMATLAPDRVLALNKSSNTAAAMVNEVATGEFLRDALVGFDFDYFSDTTSVNKAGLMDLVSYGTVVVGSEGGRRDEIGELIDDLGYYYSIGGKVVIFGRWGDIAVDDAVVDTAFFLPGTDPYGYTDYFGVEKRVRPRTIMYPATISLYSDMAGAHSVIPEFPDLVCDSAALMDHSGVFTTVTGMPCPSYPLFTDGADPVILYTYNSSVDSILTEGQPVAWRNADADYVCFDFPLSFMERDSAIVALRAALATLGMPSAVDNESDAVPGIFSLRQNYPNPFNAVTVIEFYNEKSRAVEMRLEVFNILGQRVRVAFDGWAQPGVNRVEWDGCTDNGQSVASGVYFYRLKSDADHLTRKMILLK
jgi:hypothetical protein